MCVYLFNVYYMKKNIYNHLELNFTPKLEHFLNMTRLVYLMLIECHLKTISHNCIILKTQLKENYHKATENLMNMAKNLPPLNLFKLKI